METTTFTTSSEQARLDDLYAYNILDSLTEQDYDDVTEMASLICDVPIALISFVDESRQWFKSRKGLPVSETPREYSFCSHAIKTISEPFIIEDSRIDKRFKDNPFVVGDPNVVFYAGVPLISENGHGLGTVCVIDNKPRTLSEKQIAALEMLSRQVINLLNLRKAKQELERHNAGLERKIGKMVAERTHEIAAHNAYLEKMNKELQAFTYISSHDLQEPLRKIQTFVSWIMERELAQLSEQGRNYLLKTDAAALRMRALINDLLAYSRTTSSEIVFEKQGLHQILAEVNIDLQEEFDEKKAQIEIGDDIELNVIPFQFRQLLYNLFSNSLKFSNPGVSPVIRISAELSHAPDEIPGTARNAGNYHLITVADNGIGFEDKYSRKIFELFHRLETADKQIGTGIGLAIVSKIIENHKGYISARSEPGIGTTFSIYLPTA